MDWHTSPPRILDGRDTAQSHRSVARSRSIDSHFDLSFSSLASDASHWVKHRKLSISGRVPLRRMHSNRECLLRGIYAARKVNENA